MGNSDADLVAASPDGPTGWVTRRKALAFGLSGAWATLLEGCGGGGGASIDQAQTPQVWNVGPLYFVVGSSTTWDLATGLPADARRGGTFGISQSGAPLPAGMTLAPSGILAVGSATAGSVTGIVFTYDEPAV
jgi:hypothetical protein